MPPSGSCLTCRSRKAKCDRRRPQCSVCCKLGSPCTYPQKASGLIWLPTQEAKSVTEDDAFQEESTGAGAVFFSRRPPLFPTAICTQQVDQMIASTSKMTVEAMLEEVDSQSGTMAVNTIRRGPFCVFQLGAEPQQLRRGERYIASTLENSPLDHQTRLFGHDDFFVEDTLPLLENGDLSLFLDDAPLFNLDSDALCSPSHDLSAYEDFEGNAFDSENSGLGSIFSMPITYVSDIADLDVCSVRRLLDCYQNNFVPCLLSVRKSKTSPWEILHIPKVHQTFGEALIQGDADDPRAALFFAVLATSAFSLDMKMQKSLPVVGEQQWNVVGNLYLGRARSRLQKVLSTISSKVLDEDIADTLLALTSMFTVSVVSGNAAEAYAYLQDTGVLSARLDMDKIRSIPGLRIILSIFSYIRILQNSVGIYNGNELKLTANESVKELAIIGKTCVDAEGQQVVSHFADLKDLQASSDNTVCSKSCFHCSDQDQTVFEQIFSLPGSLYHFVSRIQNLIKQVEADGRSLSTTTPSDNSAFISTASQLEKDIWDWYVDQAQHIDGSSAICPTCSSNLTAEAGTNVEASCDVPLCHYRSAMHAAVLIYFYRGVKRLDSMMIQYLVVKAVNALLRCAQTRQKRKDPSSMICWPLFMAGCEASEPTIRKQVLELCTWEGARIGQRMYEVVGLSMEEIWRTRDRRNDRNIPWQQILRESTMLDGLLLS